MHAGYAIGNYTAQINRNGHITIVKGDEVRYGYQIAFRGGFHACKRYMIAESILRPRALS